ncbi:hypothetical protein ACHAPU_000849 [Fusarium lateritium]
MVKYLIQKAAVDPDVKDKNGRTPLSHAAESGLDDIVDTLLDLDAVNPDSRDSDGKSPYFYAVEHDHEEVAEELAYTEQVNVDVKGAALEARRMNFEEARLKRKEACSKNRISFL